MADLSGFNADAIDISDTGFEPLPKGSYPVVITGSEMKPTKKGDGEYLELTLEVIDGAHKGRLIWDRLNLHNPNPKAVEIATKSLAQICQAVGVHQPKESAELHHKPLVVRVDIEHQAGYEPSNRVRGYAMMAGVTAQAHQAPASEPVNTKMPWQ